MATLLLLVAALSAQGAPRVAIVGVHQGDLSTNDQAVANEKIEKAVKKQGVDPVAGAELAAAIRGREGVILKEAFLGPGEKLLEDGRDLYQQAAFEEAEPVLLEAIETLTLGVGSANSAGALWEAYTVLGTIRLLLENKQGAADAFAQAIALNPARTPNAAHYPPDVLWLYNDTRDDLRRVSSTLRVKADEENVRIFLNGEDQGLSPAVIRDVIPGENHIVARGASGSHAYRAIVMDEGGSDVAVMRMAEPSLGSAAGTPIARSRQTATLYRSFGEHSGVDLVLLAGTTDGTAQLQLYSPRTAAFSTPVELEFNGSIEDEVAASIPDLFKKVRDDGTFFDSQTAPLASPLDVGSNKLLATMLLNPDAGAAIQPKGRGIPVWAAGVIGVAVAGAATGAVLYATSDKGIVNNGNITLVVD